MNPRSASRRSSSAIPKLVLASRSPQRRAILEQLGVDFEVVDPQVEEIRSAESPRVLVEENARRKAAAAAGELVLGVDTVVVLDGRIIGKPGDGSQAREHLEALSGREHEVWSGICLSGQVSHAVTRVRFNPLLDEDLDWYLATGEWRERAGGYAIQGKGAALVAEIAGDYWNVVGLPVAELNRMAPGLIRNCQGLQG
ncbi:MAG: septum formation protein Maf [Thermoleophilaceae bacterium]|nr:septum formation protein Maf [Thermoleophilaceae bacterium]